MDLFKRAKPHWLLESLRYTYVYPCTCTSDVALVWCHLLTSIYVFFIHERVDGLHHLRNLIFWTYVSDAKISRAIKNASLDYHQKYTYTATRTGCANYNCDSYVSARQTNTHMTKHYFSTYICVADCDVIYWRLLTSIKCFAYIFTKSLQQITFSTKKYKINIWKYFTL